MKPVIVGLTNPYDARPENALVPFPKDSAGYKLWTFLGSVPDFTHISKQSWLAGVEPGIYVKSFERYNLFTGPVPKNRDRWRAAAGKIRKNIEDRSTVFLLGTDVLQAFSTLYGGTLQTTLLFPQVHDRITWRLLPHPSGRNTKYNDPVLRTLAGLALADAIAAQ